METNIRLLFWLYRSKANQKGLAPLYMRITIGGAKTEVATGLQLLAKSWNAKSGSIRGATNEAKEMNRRLDILKAAALKAYHWVIEQQLPITPKQVKQRMTTKGEEARTLVSTFEYHNRLLAQKVGCEAALATLSKYELAKVKLERFIRLSGAKDIILKALSNQFVLEFEAYLKGKEKLSHNTAIKTIQLLKKVIHMAIANEWIQYNPFKSFRCSLIHKDRGYLTQEELQKIERTPINLRRLNLVRELFVFGCYTGLSYADMKQLCCRHIETRQDGKRWIVLNRQKTGIRSAIPLLPQAIKILDRYEAPFLPDNDTPMLPVISNQKMNIYLKEVAKYCGVDKKLTFHLARHSFATTVCMSNGMDISSISKMLGHTSIKTTEQYSKVVDSKVEEEMRQLQIKICA